MITITDDYCSYEVAKLIKEKGFRHEIHSYREDGKPNILYVKQIRSDWNEKYLHPNCISCPTHQMAMKWLREKDIDIIIMPLFKLKEDKIYCYEIHSDTKHIRTGQFKIYEEAIEAALKYVLENII